MKGALAKNTLSQTDIEGHQALEQQPRSGVSNSAISARSTSPDKSREALIAAVGRGDKAAFATLFEQVAPQIKGYLIRLGSLEDQAEEITQDVMVAVWRKARTYDPDRAAASTWIFRIARNRRIDIWRRQFSLELDPDDPGLLREEPKMPLEILDAAQQAQIVRTAVAALPDDLALVLRLAYFEGLTHCEVAQKLGIPLGTAKSRIRKAVKMVRKALDPRPD